MSKGSDNVAKRLFGSRWVIPLIVLLLAFIVAMVVTFTYVAGQRDMLQTQIGKAGDQRVLLQQITAASLQAAQGDDRAFSRLADFKNRFDQNLAQLDEGSSKAGIKPVPDSVRDEYKAVSTGWKELRTEVDRILDGRSSVAKVNEYAGAVRQHLPELIATYERIVRALVDADATPDQIYIASRQLTLAQRMQSTLGRILSADPGAASAADQFGRDAALFGRVLEGMLRGDRQLGVEAVEGETVRKALREAAVLFSSVYENVEGLLEASPEILNVSDAAVSVSEQAPELFDRTSALEEALQQEAASVARLALPGYGLGAAALVVLLLLGYQLVQDSRRRLQVTEAQNERNQQAILTLLDEMMNLADGDLTTHATVTEDITGAIADSVNYSIDALRELVATINRTAERVGETTEHSRASSLELAELSQKQLEEINDTSGAVSEMSEAIEGISSEAGEAASVAQSSVEVAHQGGENVRQTIDGMHTIREQIQETSKRIKRLGESSQEIGDIVGLITDIADQTNILALNAAIQASMAGEAGRGFAVVADEVQRLAERVGNATKQIEGLVKTIQTDTNEAQISMEKSTSDVVEGAKLAENAGRTLEQIEEVSGTLANRIQAISGQASEQRESAVMVRDNMNHIRETTSRTAEETTEAAERIGQLDELVRDLRGSVAGFKLPETPQSDAEQ